MASRCVSQRRVLPSMSVKRNVTVPLGRGGKVERRLEVGANFMRVARYRWSRCRSLAGSASKPQAVSVLLALRHDLGRRLKPDLGMRSVTERLFARGAAAAQKHRGLIGLDPQIAVVQIDETFDFVRSIPGRGNFDVTHVETPSRRDLEYRSCRRFAPLRRFASRRLRA